MISDEILAKLIGIISDWEKETEDPNEFKKYTIENYATIVENYSVLSDSFVKLMAWVIGEYTNKLYLNDEEKIKGILEMLSYLLNKNYDDQMTKCFLITAITKIHSKINYLQFLHYQISAFLKMIFPGSFCLPVLTTIRTSRSRKETTAFQKRSCFVNNL
jgi:hypothetical protein